MPINLILGGAIGSPAVGSSPWTPAALFSPSDVGRWGDPSDLTTVFQDSAGTTAITADGQVTGLYRDKSGKSNHVSQTVAGAKPLWKTSGGLSWLEADGVDDYLSNTSPFMYAAGKCTSYVAVRASSQTDKRLISEGNNPSTIPIYALVQSSSVTGTNVSSYVRNDAATVPLNSLDRGAVFDGTDHILGVEDSGSEVVYYKDGVEIGRVSYTRAGVLTLNTFAIFCLLRNTPGSFFAARLYGDVEIGRAITAQERSSLVTYLARKQGRIL